MSARRYPITEVVIETPRYRGTPTGLSDGGEHDIIGHGWAEIDGDSITIAVHPRGVAGLLEPKQKRTYLLADISSWHTTGNAVGFGVGKIGLFATNGAEAPIHVCEMKCDDADAARQLSADAMAAGLSTGSAQPFHSGI
jgi:hypothetical protein